MVKSIARGSRRVSSAERRQKILDAARPLFADLGFRGVTTRAVAEAAAISEALLYRHFESKEELYKAVLASCSSQVADDAQQLHALPDNTATLVLAAYLVMRGIQFPTTPSAVRGDVPRLMLRSLLSDGEFARSFVSFAAEQVRDKIERCVRVAINKGDVRGSVDAAVCSFWFSHHVAIALVMYRLPAEPIVPYPVTDRRQLLDLSVRYALRGIGLTDAAIEKHYRPEEFALLSGRKDRG